MIRPSAVAGTWYSAHPPTLTADIDAFVGPVHPRRATAPIRALLVPHAGLVYSGPTAGAAFRAAAGHRYECIVLVGPSHYLAFEGVAATTDEAFATPLGTIPVDTRDVLALVAAGRGIGCRRDAHAREHAIEMELPFVARLFPETPIVPLVMGDQRRATVDALAEAIVQVCSGRDVLLIASSDLSHFFDAAAADRLDERVERHVSRFDEDGLMAELERYPEEARSRYVMCGGGPAVAVMRAARALGATRARVLDRTHSGHRSGDMARVVGYMGAAFAMGDRDDTD